MKKFKFTSKSRKRASAVLVLLAVLLVSYQNCAPKNFSKATSPTLGPAAVTTSGGTTTTTVAGTTTTTIPTTTTTRMPTTTTTMAPPPPTTTTTAVVLPAKPEYCKGAVGSIATYINDYNRALGKPASDSVIDMSSTFISRETIGTITDMGMDMYLEASSIDTINVPSYGNIILRPKHPGRTLTVKNVVSTYTSYNLRVCPGVHIEKVDVQGLRADVYVAPNAQVDQILNPVSHGPGVSVTVDGGSVGLIVSEYISSLEVYPGGVVNYTKANYISTGAIYHDAVVNTMEFLPPLPQGSWSGSFTVYPKASVNNVVLTGNTTVSGRYYVGSNPNGIPTGFAYSTCDSSCVAMTNESGSNWVNRQFFRPFYAWP